MTDEEIYDLFQAYRITLGCDILHAKDIISGLKTLDRKAFDLLITQAFTNSRSQGSEHGLAIVRNDKGQLVVQ